MRSLSCNWEPAFVGVPMLALLRLDHRVRFYLWKACNEAKVNPVDLLKTQGLKLATYAGLLNLTLDEKLEDPPRELPAIQGEMLENRSTPTREARRYLKQILLHAEHSLFGRQPNFRELQLDARFIPAQTSQTFDEPFGGSSVFRRLVCFKPPPHGGEEVAPSTWVEAVPEEYEFLRDEHLPNAKWIASDGGLKSFKRNLLPLYNFELPHLEELLETSLQRVELVRKQQLAQEGAFLPKCPDSDDEDPWPHGVWVEAPWPTTDKEDSEENYPSYEWWYPAEDSWVSCEYGGDEEVAAGIEDSWVSCEYGGDEEVAAGIGFRGVVQVPLVLVTHYMRKQVIAVLGERGLKTVELAVMHAIGSKENKFEYMALKKAFPVLPKVAEARELMTSPASMTWSKAMASIPTVGRALFTIGIEEVFQGDKQMQDAVEAAAKADRGPFWQADCIARGITCSPEGEIRITADEDGRIYRTLKLLDSLRFEDRMRRSYIPVFHFAMGLLEDCVPTDSFYTCHP